MHRSRLRQGIQISFQMGISISDNGTEELTRDVVEVRLSTMMDLYTKDIGLMINQMDLAEKSKSMEMSILVTGKMVRNSVMVRYISMRQATCTKEIFMRINNMEMAERNGKMVQSLKESFRMVQDRVKEE